MDSTVTTVTLTDNLSGYYSAGKCLFPEGASYAFDQSWDKPYGTSEGILRAEAHTHFTIILSSIRFFINEVMIYRHDSGKRLSRQNHAKFAPCRINYAERITIPPDDLNATLSQNPTIVSDDLQADFQ